MATYPVDEASIKKAIATADALLDTIQTLTKTQAQLGVGSSATAITGAAAALEAVIHLLQAYKDVTPPPPMRT